uniref:Uncharacterized protein n=1 Tax=Plectus sambesii TaxID=2011161 RepID=A0A914V1J5_9BILA
MRAVASGDREIAIGPPLGSPHQGERKSPADRDWPLAVSVPFAFASSWHRRGRISYEPATAGAAAAAERVRPPPGQSSLLGSDGALSTRSKTPLPRSTAVLCIASRVVNRRRSIRPDHDYGHLRSHPPSDFFRHRFGNDRREKNRSCRRGERLLGRITTVFRLKSTVLALRRVGGADAVILDGTGREVSLVSGGVFLRDRNDGQPVEDCDRRDLFITATFAPAVASIEQAALAGDGGERREESEEDMGAQVAVISTDGYPVDESSSVGEAAATGGTPVDGAHFQLASQSTDD